MIKKTFLLLLLINVISGFSQNSISGVVIDKQNSPLPFANILLRNISDKKDISGSTTNIDGFYNFGNIENGRYFLEVSVLGFETIKSDTLQLVGDLKKELNFTLKEETQTLNEVVVKGNRPVIKQTAEKLIVNLENSEMVNTNLQDVVKKVPGVIMTNGKISYAGQGGIRILINGKTTDYMDTESLLRDFPADNIAKVELIQQPGAEYDAEGSGPILNIVLKKNVKLGTHGSLKTMAGYENEFEYSTGVSVASYKNKLNWQIAASHRKSTSRDDLFLSRDVGGVQYNQESISPFDPRITNLNGGFDYYFTKNNSVGISANSIQSNSDRVVKNVTTITDDQTSTSLFTDNSFERERVTFTLNPYYEFENDKNKLTVDYNYVNYSYDNENNLFKSQPSTIVFNNQRYFQDAEYKINTYKLDYKRTINDNFSWSNGAKYSVVNSDSDLQSFTQNEQEDFVLQINQSNRFLVNETILAFYTKINAKVKSWSFSGGLRWEKSDTDGTSTATQETNTRAISKLFPSASISKDITDELGVGLAYSYRIQRPSYNSLNSFVYYYDPYTFEEGNPNLKPAFTNRYRLNFTYEKQPFLSFGYSDTKDALFEIISQNDASAETSRTIINIANNKTWFGQFFVPLDIVKGLDGYAGIQVVHNAYVSENLATPLDLSKWSFTGFLGGEYQLPWDINSEVSGFYTSGGLEGIIAYEWIAGIEIAFSKKFLKDKLKVSLEYEEILQRPFYGAVNYDNVNATIKSDWARHNVFLQFNYSFGSKFGKDKNRKNASEDEQNRIKLDN
jgi:hypothetical protein